MKSRRVDVSRLDGRCHAGRFEAMASPCEVLVDGATAAQAAALAHLAAAEIWRIETHWSRYRRGNIVHAINHAAGKPVRVDDETARFLDYAQQLFELSDGLFDVTSGVLRRVWRFDGSDRVPTQRQIDAVLPLVGWHRVDWQAPWLRLQPGMEIDFGGIGKEYAVDRALALLRAHTSQPLLVNCGGDLAASGPRADGTPWRIGVDIPARCERPLLTLRGGGLASSGDAHRFLLKDGIRYPHVLDPRTGRAVVGGPRAVTVRAATCTEAGVLSTLALLHGADAERYLQSCDADATVWW